MPENYDYILPFVEGPILVKRPDLRLDEVTENGINWQWWMTNKEYGDELKNDQNNSVIPLSVFPSLSGINEPSFYDLRKVMLPYLQKFTGEQDPAITMALFCECHRYRVYPPPWLLNDLYKRFSSYLADKLNGGDKRLGEYFGESEEGARNSYFSKMAFASTMETAMQDINRFRIWFGLRKDDAIDLVAQYLQTVEDNNKTTHRFHKGFSAIAKEYKLWSKKHTLRHFKLRAEHHPPSRDDKVKMVQRYPKDAFDVHRAKFNEYLND